MAMSIHLPASPPAEPAGHAAMSGDTRRDAPAGTWQAWQAERVRQQAALAPAPPAARAPGAPGRRPEPGSGPAPEMHRPQAGSAPYPVREDALAPALRRDDAQGRDSGDGGGRGRSEAPAAEETRLSEPWSGAAPDDLDPQALAASIAARAPRQELFELLLADGRRLGVLLAPGPGQVLRVLLASSDARLRRQLDAGRMELERGLAQRMGQAAQVTVL